MVCWKRRARGMCGPEGGTFMRKVLIGLGAIVGALLVILLASAALSLIHI